LLLLLASTTAPPASAQTSFDDAQSARMMALLNGQSCAQRVRELVAQVPTTPVPGTTPAPSSSPIAPIGPGGLYATPFPTGSPPVTPLPIPSPTPSPTGSTAPVPLIRSTAPPSIAPAQPYGPSPSPAPTGMPTLQPGYVAVMADKVTGSTKPGVPGDATGNVHIFYRDEVLIGDRAHYDGVRTITVTGNPYIIDNAKDSVFYADKITFDTVSNKAQLFNGRGESSQGVETGLVYFGAKDLRTDEHGVTHGNNATVTTCERPRAGYHLTGRTIDVYPGDRIVISKAVLWLGAAAVFFLPRVVIPLRTVSDERRRPQFFPEVGYNSYQGYYMRARLSFGATYNYYGYYTVEFYSKQGLTLGYNGSINRKNGKRSTNINVQRVQNRLENTVDYNASIQDQENFSQTLRGQFSYNYTGNYGPLISLPPSNSLQGNVAHNNGTESQTYSFNHTSTGSQQSSDSYGFGDTRSFGTALQNNFTASISRSQSSFGGFFSSNALGTVNDLFHWNAHGADYELTFQKNFAQNPYGINKEPELQIRPYTFFSHFIFPVAPTLTVGQYNEPQTPETTTRADLALTMGPALYHVLGSDFSANVNVHQYAYGTGDLKASIQQILSLNTQVGTHISNSITYNENNYNGPAAVPFATLDLQNSANTKSAGDTLRFSNGEIYTLSLNFNTLFNGIAQPVIYDLTTRPSPRSYALLSGSFNPGPGQGFFPSTLQFSTPFGRGAFLQFMGTLDWKNKGRIENKSIYYSRIIGDCYQVQIAYNELSKQVNVTVNLLAFPSHAATFGLQTNGSIIPSSFNGYGYP
jgi:hypothetical protein